MRGGRERTFLSLSEAKAVQVSEKWMTVVENPQNNRVCIHLKRLPITFSVASRDSRPNLRRKIERSSKGQVSELRVSR